ncbi:MAG: Asp-tRNA(Asn)/Glu-tRNA(Gln) amidotransferase subunit GatB [Bacillota bacterium]
MNVEAVIGLEIHVEMQTKSKMFSVAPVTYKSEPNTAVVPLDLGHPGTLPVVNRQAIINAIQVCHALHLNIDSQLWFDRKNYFYPDLPKGYQITQNARPIGSEGWIEVMVENQPFKIRIERLHVEEDTAMQHHYEGFTLVDYNRAGIPLMEIVTKPDIRNGAQAAAFVDAIRQIVSFLKVSSGKMEEGSLRCDVNISVRPVGTEKFGTKVEIKNLNSIANVQRAIDVEMLRQERSLIAGIPVQQETRRYDELKKETIMMRKKTDAVDYKYFTEPNILPIDLSEEFIARAISHSLPLATTKRSKYQTQFSLSEYDAIQLTQDVYVSEYFDRLTSIGNHYKLYANWLLGDIASFLNKHNLTMVEFPIQPQEMVGLITMIAKGDLSNKQAKELFEMMIKNPTDPRQLAEKMNMLQISDEGYITQQVQEVLTANPQSIIDFQQGKDRAVGFLIGQIMKKTGGKVNPSLTNQILMKLLKSK